jgi:hypothetical protein
LLPCWGVFATVWLSGFGVTTQPKNHDPSYFKPQFRHKCWVTQLSQQLYQRWWLSCAAVVMGCLSPDGSFLDREILAGCYGQLIFLPYKKWQPTVTVTNWHCLPTRPFWQ